MRICTAYKDCEIQECKHKIPHDCDDMYMHVATVCHDSGIISSCINIHDGKIRRNVCEVCPACGANKITVVDEDVLP